LPAITQGQTITTFAGNGSTSYSGEGVAATSAGIPDPQGGAFDKYGNYYFGDGLNSFRVRKITVAGIITTVAGTGSSGFNGDGILATNAQLGWPDAVRVDTSGNLYVVDGGNHRIRKVNATTGIISTIAGTGSGGFGGDGTAATAAKLYNPQDACLDKKGNLYIADYWNNRVRKVSTSGIITTIAGGGTLGVGDNGPATTAQLIAPWTVAVDDTGNVFIGEESSTTISNRVRKVDTFGIITTVAGDGTYVYVGDGIPATVTAISPVRIIFDTSGQLYIAEDYNRRVRKIDHSGIIHTVAGNGMTGFSGDGVPATDASIDFPGGVAFDACSNLYVPDANNRRIRKIAFNPTCNLASLNVGITTTNPPISIYPNPAYEQITITANSNTTNITITDLLGQTVLTRHVSSPTSAVNITGLSAGIYFVTVTDENNNKVVRKIVKQ